MAAWWQPNASGHLGRVTKPLILEAVREGVTPQAAENIAALPKAEMADKAEALLTGPTGFWPRSGQPRGV